MSRRPLPALTATMLLAVGSVALVVGIGRVEPGALGFSRLGATAVIGQGFPKVIVTPTGERRRLAAPPRRLVSLMLGADETLTALVDPERIAAVSRFADNPLLSTCADRVPDRAARIRGLDPERILALEPDMVFAASYTLDAAVRIFDAAGVPVVRFDKYESFEAVARNVRVAAAAVGRERAGEALIDEMHRRLARVAARVEGRPRPRVLYYSPVGYTTGSGTLTHEKLVRAGGRNVVAEAGLVGHKTLGIDMLVSLDPEVIVVPLWSRHGPSPVEELTKSPAWGEVRAVRDGRVYALEARWLTSVSPDAARGVEALARRIHPEVFGS